MNAAKAAAAAAATRPDGPRLVKAFKDKIVYNFLFDLPDAGLMPPGDDPETEEPATAPDNNTPPLSSCWYPTQLRRSVVGNWPYDAYAPRMQFLQLGEVQAHRSALAASKEREVNSAETMTKVQMHATTGCMELDDVKHKSDKEMTTSDEHKVVVWAYLMTQYNLKPGLHKFGAKGEQAAMSELTQLHVLDTLTVMDPTKLTREEQAKALSLLLFLKEKRFRKIKGQGCINGAPQRAYISKEEAASSTVSTESIFIMSMVVASKRRHVRCYDVPSACVNTDGDENVLMVLRGELAEMMVHNVPQIYRMYIMVDRRGTSVLYVKLQKALYRVTRASLLFYRKL
jgi:hypothetical protein